MAISAEIFAGLSEARATCNWKSASSPRNCRPHPGGPFQGEGGAALASMSGGGKSLTALSIPVRHASASARPPLLMPSTKWTAFSTALNVERLDRPDRQPRAGEASSLVGQPPKAR